MNTRNQEAWDELRQERDELAAQVEVMRGAIGEAMGWNWLSDVESIPESVSTQLADALALPNTASAILRQRDASVLRNASDTLHCRAKSGMRDGAPLLPEIITACMYARGQLRDMAEELEENNG